MKIHPHCAPCLLSRVYYEAALSTNDEELQSRAMKAALSVLNHTFAGGVPAGEISTRVHRQAYLALGDPDPYASVKRLSNAVAAEFLPLARDYVLQSKDSFKSAVTASIIGNSLDFGVQGFEVPLAHFKKTFSELAATGLTIDDTPRIQEYAAGGRVVYLADNCGEILFDTLLFEQLHALGAHIILVVRGAPILNDATLEDVHKLRIHRTVEQVLTTGSNAIGVCIKEAPAGLITALETADIIISKGMANYETLSEHSYRPIAHLLRAKCEPVARSIGTEKGSLVAKLYT